MKEVKFNEWLLNVDAIATRAAYNLVEQGSPEDCGCPTCLNFATARKCAYPAEILALFEQLEVDPTKEAEIYHVTRLDSGLHLYGGWLHFIGCIQSGDDAKVSASEYDAQTKVYSFELRQIGECFCTGFTEKIGLCWNSFKGKPLVQIEFTAEVPWVLEGVEESL